MFIKFDMHCLLNLTEINEKNASDRMQIFIIFFHWIVRPFFVNNVEQMQRCEAPALHLHL